MCMVKLTVSLSMECVDLLRSASVRNCRTLSGEIEFLIRSKYGVNSS
jgi:hypothetical protein